MARALSKVAVSVPEVDEQLQPFFDKTHSGLAGAAIMAVNKNGEVIYGNAFGRVTYEHAKDRPMTMDTICWLASQTKLMTAIAVMQCVERGQIGLDDPIGNICPEMADPEVIEGFEEDGTPRMRKAERKITLRNLLSHTSGLGYEGLSTSLSRWIKATGFDRMDNAYPLLFEPDSAWEYGFGITWAGRIVERLNKCTLGAFMEKNILAPLGMTSTTFHPDSRLDLMSRLAGTVRRQADGTLAPCASFQALPAQQDSGGGGAYSTCEDFIKLLTALLRDGRGILTKASVDEIFTPHLTGSVQDGHIRDSTRRYPPGIRANFGLTVEINVDAVPGGRAPNSGRWGGMPCMEWWVDRETGIAATIFQQLMPPSDPTACEFTCVVERALYKHVRGG